MANHQIAHKQILIIQNEAKFCFRRGSYNLLVSVFSQSQILHVMHSITLIQNIHSMSKVSPTQDMNYWDCLKVEYYCQWRWQTSHITITVSQREHNAENQAAWKIAMHFYICHLMLTMHTKFNCDPSKTLEAVCNNKKSPQNMASPLYPFQNCICGGIKWNKNSTSKQLIGEREGIFWGVICFTQRIGILVAMYYKSMSNNCCILEMRFCKPYR